MPTPLRRDRHAGGRAPRAVPGRDRHRPMRTPRQAGCPSPEPTAGKADRHRVPSRPSRCRRARAQRTHARATAKNHRRGTPMGVAHALQSNLHRGPGTHRRDRGARTPGRPSRPRTGRPALARRGSCHTLCRSDIARLVDVTEGLSSRIERRPGGLVDHREAHRLQPGTQRSFARRERARGRPPSLVRSAPRRATG